MGGPIAGEFRGLVWPFTPCHIQLASSSKVTCGFIRFMRQGGEHSAWASGTRVQQVALDHRPLPPLRGLPCGGGEGTVLLGEGGVVPFGLYRTPDLSFL